MREWYPGVMSVLRIVLPDGMGFGWFKLDPGVFGYEPPRTFEGGLGLWGYLRAATAYVVEDETFGLVGYGCRLDASRDEVRAFPTDGVRKRVRFVAQGIDVKAQTGEIVSALLDREGKKVRLEMSDSTGLVETIHLEIRGLRAGDYEVGYRDATERRTVTDVLRLALPADRAEVIRIERI
jgi:hypothetical protein